MDKRQAQLDGHFASQVWSEEELAVLIKRQPLKNWHALKSFVSVKKVLQSKKHLEGCL